MAVARRRRRRTPDAGDMSLFEQVHVVGQVADHQQGCRPRLAHEEGQRTRGVSGRGQQHEAPVTEDVVAGPERRQTGIVGGHRIDLLPPQSGKVDVAPHEPPHLG